MGVVVVDEGVEIAPVAEFDDEGEVGDDVFRGGDGEFGEHVSEMGVCRFFIESVVEVKYQDKQVVQDNSVGVLCAEMVERGHDIGCEHINVWTHPDQALEFE